MGLIDRLWVKSIIDEATGCWLFLGSRTSEGYGRIRDGGRVRFAHRAAYEKLIGPVPEGLTLDHVRSRGCQYKNCWNPDHLEPVSSIENIRRGGSSIKTSCPQGHPYDGHNKKGGRICLTCRRLQNNRSHHRRANERERQAEN